MQIFDKILTRVNLGKTDENLDKNNAVVKACPHMRKKSCEFVARCRVLMSKIFSSLIKRGN